MPEIDFAALQAAVDDAKREADEATAASQALALVNEQLAAVQDQVSTAIEASNRENAERAAALQRIIEIVSAGLGS